MTINYTFRFSLILVFFFIGFSIKAQNTINPNGWNIFRDGRGQVSSEGLMKNGKPEGYWKAYFISGQLKSEGNWRDGKLDSLWTFYNDQSDTTKKISYRYGMKNGFMLVYNVHDTSDVRIKNTVKTKELYLNNVKTGKSYYYDKYGRLEKELYFDDGRKQGPAKEYDTLGNIISLLEYNKGHTVRYERINRHDSQNRKQNTWKELYPNDRTKIEKNYLDDKLHGYVKEFGPTGRLISAKRYEHGELLIESENKKAKPIQKETFYDSGTLKTSGTFIKDIPIGTHKIYDNEGTVAAATTYDSLGVVFAKGIFDKEGLKQKDWTFYYDDGKIKSQGVFKDNKKTGNWKFHFKNGKIEQEGKYTNDKQTGEWAWYYENENLLRIENFYKSKRDGMFIEYSIDGDTITYGGYIDGFKEGKWFYHVGDHIETGDFQYGLRTGEWQYFFINGKIKFEGEFTNDKPNGKHIYYYENGFKRLESYYRDGVPEKTWRYFDEAGLTTITISYKNGKEYKIDRKKILN